MSPTANPDKARWQKNWSDLKKADEEGRLHFRPRTFGGSPLVIDGRKYLTCQQAAQYLGLATVHGVHDFLRRFEGQPEAYNRVALTDLQAAVELSPFTGLWRGQAVIPYARFKRRRERWEAEKAKEVKSAT